jgi:hypothetical protein
MSFGDCGRRDVPGNRELRGTMVMVCRRRDGRIYCSCPFARSLGPQRPGLPTELALEKRHHLGRIPFGWADVTGDLAALPVNEKRGR